jgi:hypothetical protein
MSFKTGRILLRQATRHMRSSTNLSQQQQQRLRQIGRAHQSQAVRTIAVQSFATILDLSVTENVGACVIAELEEDEDGT